MTHHYNSRSELLKVVEELEREFHTQLQLDGASAVRVIKQMTEVIDFAHQQGWWLSDPARK